MATATRRDSRRHFLEKFQPLDLRLGPQDRQPGDVAARLPQAAHEALSNCIADPEKDDRDLAGCIYRRRDCGRVAVRDDEVDTQRDEFGRELRQLVPAILGPAFLEPDGKSGFAKTQAQVFDDRGVPLALAEQADRVRPVRWLRVQGKRQVQ